MYQLFYDGDAPDVPVSRTDKEGEELWGSAGKDARLLAKFRRHMRHTDERDRKLLLQMAEQMAHK
jgi:hypothetical protein